ncbi:MAG: glycosyltransferase [Chloroflexi bacterium]|nr:glycosyltransferase [Chloroflexota bacterium]
MGEKELSLGDIVQLAYILSVYPSLSETFIAREITQLLQMGYKISICRIKPIENKKNNHLSHLNLTISPYLLNPAMWFLGAYWAWRARRNALKIAWQSYSNSGGCFTDRLKLLVIFLTVLGMAYYLHEYKISHIRANFLHTEAISAYWLSILLDVPYSITVHTRMIYFPKQLMQEVLENTAFCSGISIDALEFIQKFTRRTIDAYLIRNGVLLAEYPAVINVRNSGIPLIIAVGRLVRKKGFDTLIQACALLKREGVQFMCHIIGSGGEYKLLEKLVIENGLQQNIRFLGALSFQDIVNKRNRFIGTS